MRSLLLKTITIMIQDSRRPEVQGSEVPGVKNADVSDVGRSPL